MAKSLQAVRGMNDILPQDSTAWRQLESAILGVLEQYGYREIRLPIVEQTQVFSRSIGDATDIVQKEMYSFEDRNGDSLTLRPEGTASCVRAALQHRLLQLLPQRLWYLGPMFRHERPQRGRQRQFHQVGAEVYGLDGPDIDAELILMTARLWQTLGLTGLRLELNSLGVAAARARYREVLTAYFSDHRDQLDEDSLSRLERNPLRILDSKNPALAPLIAAAPTLADYLDDESSEHFAGLTAMLDDAGIAYVRNPRLVRGLDYYSRTVFEWVTDELGAQGTVCAGGRYDGLVALMGGPDTPAIGFAMGLERLLDLCVQAATPLDAGRPVVYVLGGDNTLDGQAGTLAESLRNACPAWTVVLHCGGGSMKSRMKRADRSGAVAAVILGADEAASNEVTVRPMRSDDPQSRCPQDELADHLKSLLAH